MTDQELLELAAKAAGITLDFNVRGDFPPYYVNARGGHSSWNPLTDDGDALRLAVKLRLHVDHHRSGVSVWVMSWAGGTAETSHCDEDTGGDLADTRRAIVRAAAAIGEQLGEPR